MPHSSTATRPSSAIGTNQRVSAIVPKDDVVTAFDPGVIQTVVAYQALDHLSAQAPPHR